MTGGRWYYEVVIDEMKEGAASRIGWSQALGLFVTSS